MAEYTILIVCKLTYGTFEKHVVSCFLFFINRSTGIDVSRWPFLVRIHTSLQINWFTLNYVNPIVTYFDRINGITGCFFCRYITIIYSKRFWGNLRIIPWVYKCKALADLFKFINQFQITNKFFITFSNNLLNPEKNIILCADIFLDGNDF